MTEKITKLLSILIFNIVAFCAVTAQVTVKLNPESIKASENITAKQISDYLYFIASDAMEGRDTPSRGLDITADFLKMNLSKWRFKPAGDNRTFFQKIALRQDTIDRENTLVETGGQRLNFGEDFIRYAGDQVKHLSASVVFVGNGWMIKSKNLNPYQGIDVKGKWVAAYGEGDPNQYSIFPFPKGITDADIKGEAGSDWADPIRFARLNRAAGVIILPSTYWRRDWDPVVKYYGGNRIYIEKFPPAVSGGQIPVYLASEKMAKVLFAGEQGSPLDDTAKNSFELGGDKTINLKITIKPETIWTQNVVAVWEGSDPVLKNEMVAIGAHYDHIGINPKAKGEDNIFNGADDDGSGTTAVLAIAEALAKSKTRPKRSILFVWHCGEEKGLWGSKYFTNYPTVDLKNVVAQLNIDMIGRSKKVGDTNEQNKDLTGENSIYIVGTKMMSSQLGRAVIEVNNSYLKLDYNPRYDDPQDPESIFFRSDHFNYAKKGIPVTFWFDGVHQDYHGADDEADRIDYSKMEKVTRTIFLTMWEVANAKTRPAIDKELPIELRK